MYPWEIEKFLKDRNYCISGDDLTFITDMRRHSQLNHIKYDPYNNSYEMWDNDGNYYNFKVKNKEIDDWER